MKKIFVLLSLTVAALSCDDGDIIVTSFDFENATLEFCGGPGDYVFYKINNDAAESIALQLSTNSELFLVSDTITITLDGTANRVIYRTYTDAVTSSYFCDNIPPTTPAVVNDYLGASGVVTLRVTTVLDDADSLPFEDSMDPEKEGFGDYDGDLLPNYIDFDDDGDNVPTVTELGADPENPQDTDGDGIADYLDPDDDNDGVLTRYEVSNPDDLNPTDNVTDPSVGPDYLNPEVANEVIVDQFRVHDYNLNSDVLVLIDNLVLTSDSEQITQESHGLGVILGIVGLILLLIYDSGKTPFSTLSILLYAGSLILLYASSTLYHAISHVEWKPQLRKIDHISIYFLIAGTYTCLLYTSPSPRDRQKSRMPSSA